MSIEQHFLTKSKFTKLIEATVTQLKIPYMEAVLYVCEKNDIEPEDVKKFISPIIKDKIEAEAMALNYLPKGNTLDSAFAD
ncbi:MAG: late promoter transcription accessory protein [Vibrio toranzoniae]|uniref:late promoter transcription accessory protein n=1 Tax=Vibrio toranzoniae TaxID=1194427 RepID=UPI003C6AB64F